MPRPTLESGSGKQAGCGLAPLARLQVDGCAPRGLGHAASCPGWAGSAVTHAGRAASCWRAGSSARAQGGARPLCPRATAAVTQFLSGHTRVDESADWAGGGVHRTPHNTPLPFTLGAPEPPLQGPCVRVRLGPLPARPCAGCPVPSLLPCQGHPRAPSLCPLCRDPCRKTHPGTLSPQLSRRPLLATCLCDAEPFVCVCLYPCSV